MKKKQFAIVVILLCLFVKVQAQSKIFKEISEDIKSATFTIMQEKAVVGYLVFTQLEKASVDSFNYRLTIMDENLNDIGKVDFKDNQLELQSIAFENDILALGYLKVINGAKKGAINKRFVQLHFLNLDGKIVKKQELKLPDQPVVKSQIIWFGNYKNFKGQVSTHVQINAAKNKGFSCLYTDDETSNLLFYDFSGEQFWKKKIKIGEGGGFAQAANGYIYILTSEKDATSKYVPKINAYSCDNGEGGMVYNLKDKFRHNLAITTFSPDPQTGNLCVAGRVEKSSMSDPSVTNFYAKKNYVGVFTLIFNGNTKKNVVEKFSYWNDNSSQPLIKSNGKIVELNGYHTLAASFRDFSGNTYFAGNILNRRTRIVNNLISPYFLFLNVLFKGVNKYKNLDGCVLKQDATGKLSVANDIPLKKQNFSMGKVLYDGYYNDRRFYPIANATNNNNYLIIDDKEYVTIFDVTKNKVVKTINHKEDRRTTIEVSGAKEGHIMIIEYNKKEKTTKLSIEAI